MSIDPLDYRRIEANQLEFEVAVAGHGDRLAILLHGFPELAFSWRHQIEPLIEAGYTVWAPNQRGYGNSSKPKGIRAYGLDLLCDDVAALVRAAGHRRCLLVGHDWGAMVAWHTAMYRPDLVERLVIMNVPHPACMQRELRTRRQLLKSWYFIFFLLPWLPERMLGARQARAVGRALSHGAVHPEAFPPEVVDVYRRAAARPGALRPMINWYRAAVWARSRHRGPFPIIDAPTLMIWGEQDVALSIEATEGTDEYVSDLELHTIADASHWVQQDAPDEVNALMKAWL